MPIDLENLAAGYSHRPSSAAGLARARRAAEAAGVQAGDVAVDIGGGRGAHAAEWGKRGALAVLVDPSIGMTREAARWSGVAVVQGESQKLPLRDDVAALAYFHLSIHYGDWEAALDEAARVLRPGGECWIWTMGEEHHRRSFLTRWFPSVGDIDAARFPPPADIAARLVSMGMNVTAGQEVEHREMQAGEWKAAVAAGFVSTLQLIPDAEFRSGLAAFEKAHPEPQEIVDYVLTFDWIRAQAG